MTVVFAPELGADAESAKATVKPLSSKAELSMPVLTARLTLKKAPNARSSEVN